jgi:hypothetical protein
LSGCFNLKEIPSSIGQLERFITFYDCNLWMQEDHHKSE